jgi:hypothetical protein
MKRSLNGMQFEIGGTLGHVRRNNGCTQMKRANVLGVNHGMEVAKSHECPAENVCFGVTQDVFG